MGHDRKMTVPTMPDPTDKEWFALEQEVRLRFHQAGRDGEVAQFISQLWESHLRMKALRQRNVDRDRETAEILERMRHTR